MIDLYRLLPLIIRTIDEESIGNDDGAIKKYVDSVAQEAGVQETLIQGLARLYDADAVDDDYLQYISEYLGYRIAIDPSDSASRKVFLRWFVRHLVALYKTKGTVLSWNKIGKYFSNSDNQVVELFKSTENEINTYSDSDAPPTEIQSARVDFNGSDGYPLDKDAARELIVGLEIVRPIHVILREEVVTESVEDEFPYLPDDSFDGSEIILEETDQGQVDGDAPTPDITCESSCEASSCETEIQLSLCNSACEATCEFSCEQQCEQACQLICQSAGEFVADSCLAGGCETLPPVDIISPASESETKDDGTVDTYDALLTNIVFGEAVANIDRMFGYIYWGHNHDMPDGCSSMCEVACEAGCETEVESYRITDQDAAPVNIERPPTLLLPTFHELSMHVGGYQDDGQGIQFGGMYQHSSSDSPLLRSSTTVYGKRINYQQSGFGSAALGGVQPALAGYMDVSRNSGVDPALFGTRVSVKLVKGSITEIADKTPFGKHPYGTSLLYTPSDAIYSGVAYDYPVQYDDALRTFFRGSTSFFQLYDYIDLDPEERQPHPGLFRVFVEGINKAYGRGTVELYAVSAYQNVYALKDQSTNFITANVQVGDWVYLDNSCADSNIASPSVPPYTGWYRVWSVIDAHRIELTNRYLNGDGIQETPRSPHVNPAAVSPTDKPTGGVSSGGATTYRVGVVPGKWEQIVRDEVVEASYGPPPASWYGRLVGSVDPDFDNRINYRLDYDLRFKLRKQPFRGAKIFAGYLSEKNSEYWLTMGVVGASQAPVIARIASATPKAGSNPFPYTYTGNLRRPGTTMDYFPQTVPVCNVAESYYVPGAINSYSPLAVGEELPVAYNKPADCYEGNIYKLTGSGVCP